MLLFKKPFHAGLESGAITLTFRRRQKPAALRAGPSAEREQELLAAWRARAAP